MTSVRARPGIDWVLVASATAAGIGVLWLLAALPVIEDTRDWTLDYVAYRDAASRFGEGLSMYSMRSLAGPFYPYGSDLYLYPPPLGIVMNPLAGIALAQGALIWYLLHVVAIVVACLLMPVRLPIRLLSLGVAALSFAVLRDLTVGNVSSLMLLPMAAAWRWLDRPAGSVALALAISVRTSFGLLLAWQALRRAWHPLLWTIGAGGLVFVVSLVLTGPDVYRDYLTMLGHLAIDSDLNSSDLAHTAITLGVAADSAWMANIVGWGIAAIAVLASLRRERETGFMVTLGASLLMAPLMWEHYLAMIVLPAAFLAGRGRVWAVGLPFLTWLPQELLPFVAIAATLLPFLAQDKASPADDQLPDELSRVGAAAKSGHRQARSTGADRAQRHDRTWSRHAPPDRGQRREVPSNRSTFRDPTRCAESRRKRSSVHRSLRRSMPCPHYSSVTVAHRPLVPLDRLGTQEAGCA